MDNWRITESNFDPTRLHSTETIFTIGNGYLSTRGTFEEGFPGEDSLTLLHGVFDNTPIFYTELANAPNWLDLSILVDGERFTLDQGRILAFSRELDLHSGVLRRTVRWSSPVGKTLDLLFERFTSLADKHLLVLRCQLTPVDFEGELEFRAGTPGHVDNKGLGHWQWLEQGGDAARRAYLLVQTNTTRISLCAASSLQLSGEPIYQYWDTRWSPTWIGRVHARPGETVEALKLVSVFTGRDVVDPKAAALEHLEVAASLEYEKLLADQVAAWASEWAACNITIEGDDEADRALRYSLFQLLIAAPRHDDRVSIAAKTLSGHGYRGHVFWDTEIFVLPFFTYTRPEIARNLLMYRYHTLPGARRKAREAGYDGAMYAWESAATGDETTPRWIPRPDGIDLIRIWCGDIELHISADVAFAVVQYWRVTGDDRFLQDYGAEIVLDTARFWGSRAEWHAVRDRYEINDVIGPDEYHDHINNSAYTNTLARWNLEMAFAVLDWLKDRAPEKAAELVERLELSPERLDHWRDVISKMYLGFNPKTRLFEQFDGFFKLHDVDLNDYEPRSISMQALLGIEGVQDYQILKQPDVLMLLYLLKGAYDAETVEANWDYYTPRTDLSFGSSLGPPIQAALAARMGDVEGAYRHFIHGARTDLEDARGNSADGFHAATAGGLWQAAVFGFGGLEWSPDGMTAQPRLPGPWQRLAFTVRSKGISQHFDLRNDRLDVAPAHDHPVRGAIFDLDGVLTDSSEFHYLGWQRLADEEGLPFDREANEALRGIPRRESLLMILKDRRVPEAQIQEMMERKNRYYLESVQTTTPEDLLPGARALLEELKGAGVKIAIGSASKNARTVLEKLGILDLVDAVSDGYSVERQKPAPDLFLHAAGQLGLQPQECVVFEDAAAGVEAALAGGMRVVGIGPRERVGRAHVVLPNLVGISWTDLHEQLRKGGGAA